MRTIELFIKAVFCMNLNEHVHVQNFLFFLFLILLYRKISYISYISFASLWFFFSLYSDIHLRPESEYKDTSLSNLKTRQMIITSSDYQTHNQRHFALTSTLFNSHWHVISDGPPYTAMKHESDQQKLECCWRFFPHQLHVSRPTDWKYQLF